MYKQKDSYVDAIVLCPFKFVKITVGFDAIVSI
jgi:hypothetical protein